MFNRSVPAVLAVVAASAACDGLTLAQTLEVRAGQNAMVTGASGPIMDSYSSVGADTDESAFGRSDFGSLQLRATTRALAPFFPSSTIASVSASGRALDALTITTTLGGSGIAHARVRFVGGLDTNATADLNGSNAQAQAGMGVSYGTDALSLTRTQHATEGFPPLSGDGFGVYSFSFAFFSGVADVLDMQASVFAQSDSIDPGAMGEGEAVLGVEWLGIDMVTDDSGRPLNGDDWTCSSSSGFDYCVGVPAPGTLALLVPGVLAGRRRR